MADIGPTLIDFAQDLVGNRVLLQLSWVRVARIEQDEGDARTTKNALKRRGQPFLRRGQKPGLDQSLMAQTRAMKLTLEEHLGRELPAEHTTVFWLVRRATRWLQRLSTMCPRRCPTRGTPRHAVSNTGSRDRRMHVHQPRSASLRCRAPSKICRHVGTGHVAWTVLKE